MATAVKASDACPQDTAAAARQHDGRSLDGARASSALGVLWGLIAPVCFVYPLLAPARAGDWAELAAGVFVQILGCVGTLFPLFSIVLYCALGLRQRWLLPDRVAELCTVFVLWNTPVKILKSTFLDLAA